jgi:hypothetical protein
MKNLVVLVLLFSVSFAVSAQFQLYKEVGQVSYYTKWSHEKWYSKKSPKVLLVKVVNKSSFAVRFDLSVEFYKNLMMVEESEQVTQCLSSGKTLLPRMAGLVFKPAELNPEEIDAFELSGIEATVLDVPDCGDKK